MLRSDVMGVEVFLLALTASGDGAGAHFCVTLPLSSQRFRGMTWKHRTNFLKKSVFLPFWEGGDLSYRTRKSRWSRVGTSKILLDFYPVISLVRWTMVRIGKFAREVVKKIDTSIEDLPLIITISDTWKNHPKRLDFDNTIKWGTGIPKDRDDFDRREVWEWECHLVRIFLTLDLDCEKNTVWR